MLVDANIYVDGKERRTLDLRPDGVTCIFRMDLRRGSARRLKMKIAALELLLSLVAPRRR